MDEKEILKKVEMLSDREKVLKDFYVKQGRLASNEEATKLIGPNIPTHPLSIWNNKSLHDRHNFHPDFSEEHFFPRETDVFFLKHECYSHIMKHCHDFMRFVTFIAEVVCKLCSEIVQKNNLC